ncbi:MAG: hypothetical protein J6V99_05060 [Neisseriaceae bacterium]|nr:hypothetical protein [Neisseriaceae bacterium]
MSVHQISFFIAIAIVAFLEISEKLAFMGHYFVVHCSKTCFNLAPYVSI